MIILQTLPFRHAFFRTAQNLKLSLRLQKWLLKRVIFIKFLIKQAKQTMFVFSALSEVGKFSSKFCKFADSQRTEKRAQTLVSSLARDCDYNLMNCPTFHSLRGYEHFKPKSVLLCWVKGLHSLKSPRVLYAVSNPICNKVLCNPTVLGMSLLQQCLH